MKEADSAGYKVLSLWCPLYLLPLSVGLMGYESNGCYQGLLDDPSLNIFEGMYEPRGSP